MTGYSVQPRGQILKKSYGFLSFAKNMGKNTDKNIGKNSSGKYSQKHLDQAKQSATDAFKTASKRTTQKTAEAIDYLIGNKIADAVAMSCDDEITNISKNSQQHNSGTVTNENCKEIPKERYVLLEEKLYW